MKCIEIKFDKKNYVDVHGIRYYAYPTLNGETVYIPNKDYFDAFAKQTVQYENFDSSFHEWLRIYDETCNG